MTDSKSRPASHKSILRVKKTNNYVVLDKGFLQDPSLSCKAKGLLSYLLSKPDDWEIRLSELCRHFSDGKDSIRKGIEELEKAGYIKKERLRGGNGKFAGVRYMVYETPCLSQKEPQTEKPDTVFPAPENPTLLNNDLTKDTSYRVATNFEVSFMSKRECIKKTARLIEDLGVENSYKVAAAMFRNADREIDWHFPIWILENLNEAIERADDKVKYLLSLLQDDNLWHCYASQLEDEAFDEMRVLANVAAGY